LAVDNTKEAFVNIAEEIKVLIDGVLSVTEDSRQMRQMKDEIVGNMESISASTEETSAATQEVSATSEEQLASMEEVAAQTNELKQLAEQLEAVVQRFK